MSANVTHAGRAGVHQSVRAQVTCVCRSGCLCLPVCGMTGGGSLGLPKEGIPSLVTMATPSPVPGALEGWGLLEQGRRSPGALLGVGGGLLGCHRLGLPAATSPPRPCCPGARRAEGPSPLHAVPRSFLATRGAGQRCAGIAGLWPPLVTALCPCRRREPPWARGASGV